MPGIAKKMFGYFLYFKGRISYKQNMITLFDLGYWRIK